MPRKPLLTITKIEYRKSSRFPRIPAIFATAKSRGGRTNRRGMLAEELRIGRK